MLKDIDREYQQIFADLSLNIETLNRGFIDKIDRIVNAYSKDFKAVDQTKVDDRKHIMERAKAELEKAVNEFDGQIKHEMQRLGDKQLDMGGRRKKDIFNRLEQALNS